MARAELRGGGVTVELDPDDGGKLTRMRCERHGREWLHGPTAHDDRDGAFGASRSWGWDELFPTVLATASAPPPWPRRLRDHGELWGRRWTVVDDATLAYDDPSGRFRFSRALELRDARLCARYELRNTGSAPLPWMWAMHPIFAIEPGDRLELAGVRSVAASYARPDRTAEDRVLGWPVDDGLRLDRLGPPDGTTALKLYAGPRPHHRARLTGRTCRLELTADLPYLGLYINLGGWPEPRSGLHQVGLEPTTAPVDDLAAATDGGFARTCSAGAAVAWSVEVRII